MPITDPTETIAMLVTTTTRKPAIRTGIDRGRSTFRIRRHRRVADRGRRVAHLCRHRVQRLEHRPHQQRDGVGRQGDNDVGFVEDPGSDDHGQDYEQRQRRDGEHDTGRRRRQPARHRGALHQHAQRHRDRQPDQHRQQRQAQVDDGQRPGVVEVGQQVVHLQPRRRASTAASTSAARIPPMTLPPSSTATPTPDGDDSAESSAWLRFPSGRNSDPTPLVLSDNDAPARCRRSPSASIQPGGAPALSTISAQPSRGVGSGKAFRCDRFDVVQRQSRPHR